MKPQCLRWSYAANGTGDISVSICAAVISWWSCGIDFPPTHLSNSILSGVQLLLVMSSPNFDSIKGKGKNQSDQKNEHININHSDKNTRNSSAWIPQLVKNLLVPATLCVCRCVCAFQTKEKCKAPVKCSTGSLGLQLAPWWEKLASLQMKEVLLSHSWGAFVYAAVCLE